MGDQAPGKIDTILGINADYHDASACLLVEGRIVAAAEEERFTRTKHDSRLPTAAMRWCLDEGGVGPGELSAVAFHEKPFTRYERILRAHAAAGPRSLTQLTRAVGAWTTRKLWVSARIDGALALLGHPATPIHYAEHHQSHAAAAFYASPLDHAAILTVDGVGAWATATIGRGAGHRIELLDELRYPASLGLFYSIMTGFCGFEVNDGEYKLMGLAPFGQPRYADRLLEEAITVDHDGAVALHPRYFDVGNDRRPHRRALRALLDGAAREADEPLGAREADIAASTQMIVETALTRMADVARDRTGEQDLCLGGGVAQNCVAVGRLARSASPAQVWVPPAPGDAGNAVGAALWTWHQVLSNPRTPGREDGFAGALLGPRYPADEIERWLKDAEVDYVELADDELVEHVVTRLAAGALVGRFSGRMEFGPRALGNRSILADPRSPEVATRLNAAVKRREGFRPFAPAVLAEHAHEWFELDPGEDRGYMTHAVMVRGAEPAAPNPERTMRAPADALAEVRSPLPACTHVDGSARVQTVRRDRNPSFHALLDGFHSATGCPVLLNTSFNRAGEPIVRTPADALRCHLAAGLDLLVLERFVIGADG